LEAGGGWEGCNEAARLEATPHPRRRIALPDLRQGFSFFERSEKNYSEFFSHRHWRKRWNQNRNSVCQQAPGIRLLERRSGGMRFAATANKRRIFVIMARQSSQGW
jgi:hypothetical protein